MTKLPSRTAPPLLSSYKPVPPRPVFERALAAHQQGRLSEAEQLYVQVPITDSRYAQALHYRGVLRLQGKDFSRAADLIQQSLSVNARDPDAWTNLALAQIELNRLNGAIEACDRALSINPKHIGAWNNKGLALRKCMRFSESIACYDCALSLNPHLAEGWANRGVTLKSQGIFEQAIANLDQALKLAPNNPQFWADRGYALADARRYEDALQSLEKSLALNADQPEVQAFRVECMQHIAHWTGLPQAWQQQADRIRTQGLVSLGFSALSNPFVTALEFRQGLQAAVTRQFAAAAVASASGTAHQHGRLRVAYLSGDFREHAMTFLLAGMFEQHDKQRFETFALSFKPIPSTAMGQRLTQAFDHVIDVSDQSDEQVAQWAREQHIDIAVDLMGHTGKSRLGIFARRAAPVQVNYLGFPATSGAPFVDYIVGDRWVTPLDQSASFTEKLVLMPDSFQGNDDQRLLAQSTPSRDDLGLPASGFVFCCMNHTYKISPMMFDIWMRLLSNVPGSVLWLLGESDTVVRHLRAEAVARGVSPDRLVFARRLPYEDYLAQYRQADLFLDTLPFNAGTTASDALWAGLPVLTQVGHTFAGRMAASLLDAVGLPELITHDAHTYEQLAFTLATQPEQLKVLRERLSRNRLSAPLFNTRRFTRHLERAYEIMVERHRQGLAPASFDVPPIEDPAATKLSV